MQFADWWSGLSRAYQNAFALLIFDTILLIGALTRFRPLHLAWEAITESVPNIFEPILLSLIALVRDIAPGATVAGSVTIIFGTMYASLLCVHVVVGFGLGFLFDNVPRSLVWTFVNFFTLILVLFSVHLFLLFSAVPLA